MLDLRGVALRKIGGCEEHVERGSFERERDTLSDDDDAPRKLRGK